MATVQDIEIPDSAARAAAIEEAQDIQGERMVLNMGPSHPADVYKRQVVNFSQNFLLLIRIYRT